VMFAVSTTLRAQRARPLRYHSVQRSASTVASRSMRVTGVLLLAFIFYHVFTIYGVGHPAFVSGNGHHNLLAVLHNPWHASAYAIATSLVALHLAHGVASTLITLGLESRKHERLVRRVMWSWCAVVIVGFSLPVVVLGLGII
jgi:succinate dehydrogenase / fumarate reductase cytochrome b subunit